MSSVQHQRSASIEEEVKTTTTTPTTTSPTAAVSGNGCSSSSSNNDDGKEVHVDPKRYKTKMCRNFMRDGECPYDTRCMFAHGPSELRTPDENVRDNFVTESAIKKHQQQLMYEARVAQQTKNVSALVAQPPVHQHSTCSCPECCSYAATSYDEMEAVDPSLLPTDAMLYAQACRGAYGCACPDCMYYAAQAHQQQYYYGHPAAAAGYYGAAHFAPSSDYGYDVYAP